MIGDSVNSCVFASVFVNSVKVIHSLFFTDVVLFLQMIRYRLFLYSYILTSMLRSLFLSKTVAVWNMRIPSCIISSDVPAFKACSNALLKFMFVMILVNFFQIIII